MTGVVAPDRAGGYLDELAPALRRAVSLDPEALVRLRVTDARATALLRLPFGVLAARTVDAPAGLSSDTTVSAADLIGWLDAHRAAPPPEARDAQWFWAVPPTRGWRRLDVVPGDVVRSLVRRGAQALADASAREGVPGAQPRADVADALLDSVVLTVTADDGSGTAQITLRLLAALTRLGFLPDGGAVSVDQAGRWTRVAARFGTVFAERPGQGLSVLSR